MGRRELGWPGGEREGGGAGSGRPAGVPRARRRGAAAGEGCNLGRTERKTPRVLPKLSLTPGSISILCPGSHPPVRRRLHTLAWLSTLLPALASGAPDWEATSLFHLSPKSFASQGLRG